MCKGRLLAWPWPRALIVGCNGREAGIGSEFSSGGMSPSHQPLRPESPQVTPATLLGEGVLSTAVEGPPQHRQFLPDSVRRSLGLVTFASSPPPSDTSR